MTKLKKMKLKLYASIGVAILVGVAVIVGGVMAYQSNEASKVVNENGTVNFYEAQEPDTIIQQLAPETLGIGQSEEQGGSLRCQNDDCTYYIQAKFDTTTTTLKGNLTVVSIPDPFLMASSTYNKVSGVVLKTNGQTGAGYQAWYGATSTVELVRVTIADKTTLSPTTTWEMDCSASTNGYSTSSLKIIDTDTIVGTSTIGIIESGISSSTAFNAGTGSFVLDSQASGGYYQIVNKILLTPTYPYLVCNIWQPYGTALDTFFGTFNTSNTQRVVNVRISRQRL